MAQFDTTKIINISKEDFTYPFDNEAYTIKAGETRELPKFIAEHLAIHLIDKILQEKPYNIKDTRRDTPIRRDLFAKIIPEITQEIPSVKILSDEERQKAWQEELKRQDEIVASFKKETEEKEVEKDKKIEELKKQIEEIKSSIKSSKETKKGRE